MIPQNTPIVKSLDAKSIRRASRSGKSGIILADDIRVSEDFDDRQYAAYKAAEIMARVLGVDIVFHRSMMHAGETAAGYFDPSDGCIHINIRAMREVKQGGKWDGKHIALYTLGHETVHYIKAWSPAKYAELESFVMEKLGGRAEALLADKRAQLTKMGDLEGLTDTEADALVREEVVADSMELVLADGEVLAELQKRNRTLWEKIRDYVTSVIEKVKAAYGDLSYTSKSAQVLRETVESLDEIKQLFYEGVVEASEARKSGVEATSRDVKSSYAGEHAKGANYGTLAEARQMIFEGMDPEIVRQKTGWNQGYDGKWRFEIDDSNIEIDTTGRFSKDPEVREYLDLMNKVYFEDVGTEEDQTRLRELDAKFQNKSIAPQTLGEIIRHPALLEAYPQLKEVAVVFVDSFKDNGSYHPGIKEITLAKSLKMDKRKLKRTLLHEIQHAVQDIESFAVGSSPSAFADIDGKSAYEQYEATAGEIEARDVANRSDLTVEERQSTRPDIDRTDVVFAEGTLENYSLGETTNGRPVVVVNDDITKYATTDKKLVSLVKESIGKLPYVAISKQKIYFLNDTKKEATYSKYTKWLRKNKPEVYKDKMRLFNHPSDIVLATTDYINEGLKHPRNDDIVDFARGEVLVDVFGNKYNAEVVIGFTKTGICELHDVVNMNPTSFEYKKSDALSTISHKGEHSQKRSSLFKESIPHSDLFVKRKFSTSNDITESNSPHAERAVEVFGTTSDLSRAGFVLPSGQMPNLSEYGLPGVQHKRIEAVFEDTDGSDPVNRFIQEGNVRLNASAPGIELAADIPPTVAQYNVISKLVSRGMRDKGVFYVDVVDSQGGIVDSVTYDTRDDAQSIIYDLKTYYRRGAFPQNELRYSADGDITESGSVSESPFDASVRRMRERNADPEAQGIEMVELR